jgi:hypothetical protein
MSDSLLEKTKEEINSRHAAQNARHGMFDVQ